MKIKYILAVLGIATYSQINAQVGVGAKAPKDAEVVFDGSRKMLDEKWIYWESALRLALKTSYKMEN